MGRIVRLTKSYVRCTPGFNAWCYRASWRSHTHYRTQPGACRKAREMIQNCCVTTPFEADEAGRYLHGTKADLRAGDLLVPGHASNYENGRVAKHVYMTQTLDAAVWGAELARGEGAGRIYVVEPQGEVEDDPNVTDKKFPGNPTRSYRTPLPVKVTGEITDWVGHTAEQLKAMRDALAELARRGLAVIED